MTPDMLIPKRPKGFLIVSCFGTGLVIASKNIEVGAEASGRDQIGAILLARVPK